MSNAGEAPADSKPYFCYQCNRVVTLIPFPNSDLNCPHCNGGFLEEHHPDPDPVTADLASMILSSSFPALSIGDRGPTLFSSTAVDLRNPGFFSFPAVHRETHVFNPFMFLQNHLQGLRQGGADIQFVIENHPSHPGFRLPPNIGDYFLGPGLEELIQRLAENDPNRHGTPPASKKALEDLPTVKITEGLISSDSVQCAVCMNDFELASEAKQMPCKHIFHSDCILPWLELHNSCPVCRYELPTDDPDYENRKENSSSDHGAGGEGESEGHRSLERSTTLERRFRISLPWPLSFNSSESADNNDQGSGSENQEGSGSENQEGSGSGERKASVHGQESREQG